MHGGTRERRARVLELRRLMWVMLKVLMAGLGSVAAELLLKQDTALPFTVRLGRKNAACECARCFFSGPFFLAKAPRGKGQDTARLTEVTEVAEVAEDLCPVC